MTNGGGDRWAECIELAVQVAVCAGKIGAGRKEQRVTSKATPTDLVTEADQLLEEFIISTLRDRFPSHRVSDLFTTIGNEELDLAVREILRRHPNTGYKMMLGHLNARGIRVQRQRLQECMRLIDPEGVQMRRLQLQTLRRRRYFVPAHNSLWHIDGNHKLIRFIGEESSAAGEECVLTDSATWIIDPTDGTCNFVHRALILTEIGAKRDVASLDISGNMSRLLSVSAHGVRIIGSSILALCQVACGRAEGYYHYGLHCWDMAAADIIIRETGTTSPLSPSIGGPVDFMSRRVVAAGSLEMANNIIQQLQPIGYERDDHDPSYYTLHISWHSCPFKNVPHAKT